MPEKALTGALHGALILRLHEGLKDAQPLAHVWDTKIYQLSVLVNLGELRAPCLMEDHSD